MPNYPILPSLSRAPSFESTRKIEDGTLKDPMESGYVATRPRFTRLRRTFGVSYKFLSAEDVRALDKFETQTVQGMAGAFYMPNLLPNGSFEFPNANGGGVSDWTPAMADGFSTISVSSQADDGASAILFSSIAFTLASGAAPTIGSITCNKLIPVVAGDVYQVSARINAATSRPSGVLPSFVITAAWTYSDGSTSAQNFDWLAEPTSGYATSTDTVSITASESGAVAAELSITISLFLQNTGGSIEISAGEVQQLVDSVGLALIGTAQPYGRMPGLGPLCSAVRFTKGLQIRDAGIANGQKTYDVTFEVTEV